MFHWIWRSLVANYLVIENDLNEIYERIWGGIFLACGALMLCVLFMVVVNVYLTQFISKEWNLVFFFGGTPLIVFLMLVPRMHFIAAAVSFGMKGLKDEDLSQAIASGIELLYWFTRGFVLWFWVVAGILSTHSFAGAPSAFFVMAAMGVFIFMVLSVYKIPGKWVPWILLAYAVFTLLRAFLSTFPDDVFPIKEDTAARSTPRDEVRVYHRETVTLQPGVRTMVQLLGGQCITASDGSEDKLYNMEGSHNKKEWFNPSEGNWEWIGLSPAGQKPVEVTYEIRRRGECS